MPQDAPGEEGERAARVLLLYENAAQVPNLMTCLSEQGYEVVSSPWSTPQEGWIQQLRSDLVLLLAPSDDMKLLAACEAVRAATDGPLVVLSVQKAELTVSRALESGADEYLVMPMGNRELVARVQAMLRRLRTSTEALEWHSHGSLRLNQLEQSVRLGERSVSLSPIEYRLLSCLASSPGRVVTHERLMSRVWGEEYVDSRHYLRLYVRYLREKLEDDPKEPKLIVSEWGIGYRLDLPEERDLTADEDVTEPVTRRIAHGASA